MGSITSLVGYSMSSSSSKKSGAAQSRVGMALTDYDKFMSQGMNMASGDPLFNATARAEQMTLVGAHYDDGIDILGWKPNKTQSLLYEREKNFKTVGQDALDKMMSMFQMRKKEVDTKKTMPGRSQLQATDFNIG